MVRFTDLSRSRATGNQTSRVICSISESLVGGKTLPCMNSSRTEQSTDQLPVGQEDGKLSDSRNWQSLGRQRAEARSLRQDGCHLVVIPGAEHEQCPAVPAVNDHLETSAWISMDM